jgi:hypothetical protein
MAKVPRLFTQLKEMSIVNTIRIAYGLFSEQDPLWRKDGTKM